MYVHGKIIDLISGVTLGVVLVVSISLTYHYHGYIKSKLCKIAAIVLFCVNLRLIASIRYQMNSEIFCIFWMQLRGTFITSIIMGLNYWCVTEIFLGIRYRIVPQAERTKYSWIWHGTLQSINLIMTGFNYLTITGAIDQEGYCNLDRTNQLILLLVGITAFIALMLNIFQCYLILQHQNAFTLLPQFQKLMRRVMISMFILDILGIIAFVVSALTPWKNWKGVIVNFLVIWNSGNTLFAIAYLASLSKWSQKEVSKPSQLSYGSYGMTSSKA